MGFGLGEEFGVGEVSTKKREREENGGGDDEYGDHCWNDLAIPVRMTIRFLPTSTLRRSGSRTRSRTKSRTYSTMAGGRGVRPGPRDGGV